MGWFHAAYAEGKIGADGEFNDGETCAYTPGEKKVQVPPCPKTLTGVEVIYHMCQKSLWDEAVKDEAAYFPPTFHQDGKFTRASVYKDTSIGTANQFYKGVEGDWICLEINLKLLLNIGIVVIPQEDTDARDGSDVQCLQVYSGITTLVPGLIKNIYPMKRGGCGTFLSLGDPIAPKKGDVENQVEKLAEEVSQIPGIGKIPGPPSEQAKAKRSPKGLGMMFGMKAK